MAVKGARIHLTIDRLVLNGFEPTEGAGIAAALQRELAASLAATYSAGGFGASRALPTMRLGSIEFGAESGPAQVGVLAGRHIGRNLRP